MFDFTSHVSRFDPDCSDAMVKEVTARKVAVTMLSESLEWALAHLSETAKKDFEAGFATRVLKAVKEAEARAKCAATSGRPLCPTPT